MNRARVVVTFVLAAGCARAPVAAAPVCAPQRAAPASVRAVDWANRGYEVEWKQTIRLEDGAFEMHEYPNFPKPSTYHTTMRWDLDAVAYGDIDGDGVEDAVIAMSFRYWAAEGDRNALELQLFTVVDGEVTRVARRTLPAGHVRRVTVSAGEVVLERGDDAASTLRVRFTPATLAPVHP